MMKHLPKYLHSLILCVLTFTTTGYAAETPYRSLGFAWGAEIGGNMDMSQHDMSSIGINAKLGLRWNWIRFLGIGAEGDMMVSNSTRVYPLFVNFRTDFSNHDRLVFFDLRGGMALTYFNRIDQNSAAFFSAGVGVTLAKGKSFSSHLILGYTYLDMNHCYNGETLRKCPGLSLASLRFGVTFLSSNENKKTNQNNRYYPTIKKKAISTPISYIEPYHFEADTLTFINTEANRIELPSKKGVDTRTILTQWKNLARDLANAKNDNEQIDIVHIGDSHIQAEMGTSRLREILQDKYGNAGRGLITAFKLAGTNQPVDYEITSEMPVDSQARLLKRPWPIKPGFTGVASQSNLSNLITYKNLKKEHSFNRARIFTSDGERFIAWPDSVENSQFYALPGERVYGVYTSNSHNPGIIYSTIGNNGACFRDYLLIDGFADDVAKFKPRLIILSMGTNEGFSSMTDEQIAVDTRQLINDLRLANPQALFMVWTPMECHDKDSDGNFKIKSRVRDARDIMIDVAKSEGIPVWDFYEVAGGYGSAQKWVNAGLMNPKDHIHLLNKGYRVQGELAAEALINFLNQVSEIAL